MQIASVDAHHWRADHRDQAHDAAQALAAHGGDGCALYAPAKAHDKENVQHDVGDGCRNHRQQWSRTVAHRPQEPREQVEAHHQGQARKDDAQIAFRHADGLLRHLQRHQGWPQEELRDGFHHRHGHNGQQDALSHRPVELIIVRRPEGLRHLDAEALSQAHRQGKHQPVQPAGGGNSRQRIHAHLAHHKGVHQGIQLLEGIACHDGQAEQNQVPGRAACGHIAGLGHADTSFAH